MKTALLIVTLLATLAVAACAVDPFSKEPEVDIDPDRIDEPVPAGA